MKAVSKVICNHLLSEEGPNKIVKCVGSRLYLLVILQLNAVMISKRYHGW